MGVRVLGRGSLVGVTIHLGHHQVTVRGAAAPHLQLLAGLLQDGQLGPVQLLSAHGKLGGQKWVWEETQWGAQVLLEQKGVHGVSVNVIKSKENNKLAIQCQIFKTTVMKLE